MEASELALILQAKQDSEAFMQLFRRYKPVALAQMKRVHIRAMAREDWLQEAQLALLRAVRQYDAKSGSQFGAYYKMILHSHYVSLLRRALAKKRAPENSLASLSGEGEQEAWFDKQHRSARNEEERRRALALDWHQFISLLSPLEREALTLCSCGVTSLTPQQRRALERVRVKVRRYLLDLEA